MKERINCQTGLSLKRLKCSVITAKRRGAFSDKTCAVARLISNLVWWMLWTKNCNSCKALWARNPKSWWRRRDSWPRSMCRQAWVSRSWLHSVFLSAFKSMSALGRLSWWFSAQIKWILPDLTEKSSQSFNRLTTLRQKFEMFTRKWRRKANMPCRRLRFSRISVSLLATTPTALRTLLLTFSQA